MARMHSKKRGKSGSKRPAVKVSPEWTEYAPHEVEELISKMGKETKGPTEIGMILRDTYGIASVQNLCGKSISDILRESGIKLEYPEDLLNLIKRAVNMRDHLRTNRSDKHNRTKLIHVESKIGRLVKYYTKSGRLPADWKYDPEKAALLVK
ncbi:TPA: 30S ribosomal protein S15 [Candidatus Micrarchaeota archaeon]|nr:30S ribosomal protein S15 [Candidatus Micrarchaeota archaeon]HIH30963.1 30S ribosomal protein S15 [Candidatus Micrarchaeota archaeon]